MTGARLIQWGDAAAGGAAAGPSSWDGYAATVVASAGVQALHGGGRIEVPCALRQTSIRRLCRGQTLRPVSRSVDAAEPPG